MLLLSQQDPGYNAKSEAIIQLHCTKKKVQFKIPLEKDYSISYLGGKWLNIWNKLSVTLFSTS